VEIWESLEACRQENIALLTARTGKPRSVVETWVGRDKVYFDSRRAVSEGLADEIIEEVGV